MVDQFLAEQHGVAIVLQRLAIGFPLHLGGVFERLLDACRIAG